MVVVMVVALTKPQPTRNCKQLPVLGDPPQAWTALLHSSFVGEHSALQPWSQSR